MRQCSAPKEGHQGDTAAAAKCPVHKKRPALSAAAARANRVMNFPTLTTEEPTQKVERFIGGAIKTEKWTLHSGELYREGAPALVEYHHNGVVMREEWYSNRGEHREDGPALSEYRDDGTLLREEWWVDGCRERLDGPAKITYRHDGLTHLREEYYHDSEAHREDGPAVVNYENSAARLVKEERWFWRGARHRIGGPAETTWNGGRLTSQEWYVNDQRHREDGPAQVVYSLPRPGRQDGEIDEVALIDSAAVEVRESWWERGRMHRAGAPQEVGTDINGAVVLEAWWSDGELHRVGGPARMEKNIDGDGWSTEMWAVRGKGHRADGPAITTWDDAGRVYMESWMFEGKNHREDGPANREWNDVTSQYDEKYWLNDEQMTKREFCAARSRMLGCEVDENNDAALDFLESASFTDWNVEFFRLALDMCPNQKD